MLKYPGKKRMFLKAFQKIIAFWNYAMTENFGLDIQGFKILRRIIKVLRVKISKYRISNRFEEQKRAN